MERRTQRMSEMRKAEREERKERGKVRSNAKAVIASSQCCVYFLLVLCPHVPILLSTWFSTCQRA